MPAPIIDVNLIPRQSRPLTTPPNYKHYSWKELQLDLLEVRAKLKKNLPLKPPELPKRDALSEVVEEPVRSQEVFESASESSFVSRSKPRPSFTGSRSHSQRPPRARRRRHSLTHRTGTAGGSFAGAEDDDDFMKELGFDTGPEMSVEDSDGAELVFDSDAEGSTRKSRKRGTSLGSETEDSDDDGGTEEDEESEEEELTPEEQKQELYVKYKILKRKYKNVKIEVPDPDVTSLEEMKKSYDAILWELKLDNNINRYQSYLVMSWFAVQMGCGYFGMEMDGFAQSQISIMSQYEPLLVELGEKNDSELIDSLPVEIRLIGMVLFQAALFYLGKKAVSNEKNGLATLISMMSGAPTNPDPKAEQDTQSVNDKPAERKTRMRGPPDLSDDE